MAAELVHPVSIEHVAPWARAIATTFLHDPAGPEADRNIDMLRRRWEPERTWGAREGDRWVASLRTESRTVTVPGLGAATRELTADALTAVTVSATHRRRGLMTAMLSESLRAAAERGDALSMLIAAAWPIYGRFGYAPATLSANYVLDTSRPGAGCGGDPSRVRQVPRDEFAIAAEAVHTAARRARAGQVNRDGEWWKRVFGLDGYAPSPTLPHNFFLHEGDAGPDGLLAWKATRDFGLVPPLGAVEVWELVSAGAAAYRDFWAYLAGLDGVDEVHAALRPVDEPLRWLLGNGRALRMTQQVDLLWVRLLDVPTALSARRYAAPGEVVLDVVDGDVGGYAAGRYALSADGDAVECARTERAADLRITQRALAAIYLGGFRLSELSPSGAVQARTPGALERLDVMFSTGLAPWNQTWF